MPKPWYEDDFFWETVSPILFKERRLLETPKDIENLVSLLGISPGARVLDLCCGVGRHSIELARRGFIVTGVDRTSAYLEKARKQAESEGLNIEFIEDDMRRFCRPETFDAVINLFTSFGYFENPADDQKVVRNVYRSLKAGGVFLIDMMGKEVLARIFRERDWYEETGFTVLEERKLCKNWEWLENRWIIFKDGEKREFKISLRLYSAAELTSLLSESGFSTVDVYGELTGTSYDHTAKRLVAVAHK